MPTHDSTLERLYADVWNGTRMETAAELVHDEYLIRDRDLAEELRGPELYTALARTTRDIFPDAQFTVEDRVSSGDAVALRWVMTGTHDGPLFGIEPTGTEVTLEGIEINRFEDGKLVETWTQSDQLGLFEQLGVAPPTTVTD